MPGIFEQIKGLNSQPENKGTAPVQKNLSKQDKAQDIFSVIADWQKSPDQEKTSRILSQLKPTIQSALHTYTPGQQNSFRLKATTYALQSLKNFDPSKKASPNTYVFHSLQRLNRIRRDRQNIIHIPQNQVYLKQQIDNKSKELEEQLGRQPTDEQLQDALHISAKKLDSIRSGTKQMLSWSQTLSAEGNQTAGGSAMSDKDFYDYVYASVSPTDKKIMQWTSGFKTEPLSNNQIAQKLKLSPGAVSQRKARIQELLSEIRGVL